MLEYIKYFTLRRYLTSNVQLVGFNGPGEAGNYINEDTLLEMPEKISFSCRMFQINWSQFYFNNDPNKYLFFNFSKNSSEGLMSEDVYKDLTFNGTQYRRYLFYSEHYNRKKIDDPNAVMQWVNDYDTLSYIEEHGESFYPMSMVITIKDEDKEKFEQFMRMDYTSWTINFDWEFRQFWYYGEPTLFDKYPPEVIVDYLSKNIDAGNTDSSQVIYLLEYIIDYWDSVNAYGHLSANRKTEIFFSILKLIKKEDAKDVYDKFFISPSYLYYTSVLDKLDGDGKVQFTFLLIKLFYMQMSEEDTIAYENQIKNLPKDHIVPFINMNGLKVSGAHTLVNKGPFPEWEWTNTGIIIKRVRFYTYMAGDRSHKELIGIENPFNDIVNKNFTFKEVIGALACFDRQEQGFMQLMVYPIPAFAFPTFANELNKTYTLGDLINDIGTTAGIIFPFFKIVQLEAVGTNLISLLLAGAGSILTDDFKNYLINEPTGLGRNFVYLYDIINSFWGGKDLGIALTEGGVKALIDIENLLGAWSLYQTTDNYIQIQSAYPKDFTYIKNQMTYLDYLYKNEKKK